MKKKIQLKQKLLTALILGLLINFNYAAFSVDCNLTVDSGGLTMNCNADGSYEVCVDLLGINGIFEVVDHSGTAQNIPNNFTIPLNGPFNQTVCLNYPNYNIYNFCVRGITAANSNDECDISLDFIGPGMCCEVDCNDGDCTNGLETWDATSCSCVSNPPSVINTSQLQTNCNANGSYDVCIDMQGYDGDFELVDHTNTATNIPAGFTLPINGSYNQTLCITYPNYNIHNFCIREVVQTQNGPCYLSVDFIGSGMCCEIDCNDGDCTNGLETWDMASCGCVSNPPLVINSSSPQTTCNANGSYKVCVNMAGYDGNFEVVDHTDEAFSAPSSFTLPSSGSYNKTICLTYPNNYIYNFCIREVVQTPSGDPCYLSVDFIGAGKCCEIDCDDGVCSNGVETWNATLCQCVSGTPYSSCSGTSSAVTCDDGNPCTENDLKSVDDCDGSICVPCAGTPVPLCILQNSPSTCNDGDPCTENDVETMDSCTGQICVPCAGTPVLSCSLQDAPSACDDGNPCTENDVEILDTCNGTVCVPCAGTPLPSCSSSTSVVSCNDNDECTTNDLQTIDDCNGSICVPCAGTPSCDDDDTPPTITLNWGNGLYNGAQLNMFCDDVTYFNESYVSVTDNCDDAPTITFTDEFIEYGDCNTTGYLSKWRCYWTATDACGNEAVYEMFITLTCSPCNDYNACTLDTYDNCDCVHEPIPNCGVYQSNHCTYPPEFYGNLSSSYGGQTCGAVVNNCLNSGAISLGLNGQSITIYTTDCIGALLPSYGGVGQLPSGNVSYTGNCAYTQPLANALAAHLLALKLNILNNPNLAYISINNQVGCVLAPQSVLQQCGGNYTVGQLSIIADYALGGYYGTNPALFNDIYTAICLVNDGFSFCQDPCVYGRDMANEIPVKNNDNISIEVTQNTNSAFIQIAMNLLQDVNNGSISVLQLNGQVLLVENFNGFEGYNQVSLNLNTLSAGIYYLIVETEHNQVYVEKVMKF